MMRSALSKVAWVGKTASMVFGLALVLALLFGVASMAFGANGGNFILGVLTNTATAVTKLTANVPGGPALQIVNNNPAASSKALQLGVAAGKPPLTVNSTAGKATNLNADKLDGKDSTALVPGGNLPAGATIRGRYEIDGHSSAGSQLIGGDSISFGFTLPSIPQARFVPSGGTAPAECPGSYIFPQAQPGFLCVYEEGRVNLSTSVTYPAVYSTTRFGAGMFAYSAGAGGAYSFGSWAVTSPTTAQAQSLAQEDRSDVSQSRRKP